METEPLTIQIAATVDAQAGRFIDVCVTPDLDAWKAERTNYPWPRTAANAVMYGIEETRLVNFVQDVTVSVPDHVTADEAVEAIEFECEVARYALSRTLIPFFERPRKTPPVVDGKPVPVATFLERILARHVRDFEKHLTAALESPTLNALDELPPINIH